MTHLRPSSSGEDSRPFRALPAPISVCQSLYEINTRVWLKRFDSAALLARAPESAWDELAERGMDMVWLMGVWSGSRDTVQRCCFEDNLVGAYRRCLPDYSPADVIGSPYSIDRYRVNPQLGEDRDLLRLKERLNSRGLRLILDFVPNHFSEGSSLIRTDPYVFLPAPEHFAQREPRVYFRPAVSPDLVLAHGRYMQSDAWGDTAQINYFCERAVEFMIGELLGIARLCDGVRCDVALLALNDVFEGTWGAAAAAGGFRRPAREFWSQAISAVKARYPGFVFIGEVYDNCEWKMQQLGFDYTYDKVLYDRLRHGAAQDVLGHLWAEPGYQRRSVRFVENHDEERAVETFGREKSRAAALIASTLMGLRFFHDGQWEGKRVRLQVQLAREPREAADLELREFYEKLLTAIKEPVFREGRWELSRVEAVGDESAGNLLAYSWSLSGERRAVVVNYSGGVSRGHVRLDLSGRGETLRFEDLLGGRSYEYRRADVENFGLYVELPGFGGHVFRF